jgi:hypothetical protein
MSKKSNFEKSKQPTGKPAKLGFFASIPASIYSPEFYAGIPKLKFGKILTYFVLLTLIIHLIFTGLLGSYLYTHRDTISQTITNLTNVYPEGLELTLESGRLSTNVQEPYSVSLNQIIPFADFMEYDEEQDEGQGEFLQPSDWDVQNLLVIDTATTFSAAQFREYETVAWATSDSIFIQSDNHEISTILFSDIPDIVITKELVDEKLGEGLAFLKPILYSTVPTLFAGSYLAMLAWRMAYGIFLALLLLLVAAISKWELKFSDCYKVTLHAMTLALLINMLILISMRWTGFNGAPFLFTLITLIIASINIGKARQAG